MSGLEIAGLVLGIIPLVKSAFDAIRALKQHHENFRLNTRKLAAIEKTLHTISRRLQALHTQYGSCQHAIPPENASIIEDDFNDLAATLTHVAESITSIANMDQSRLTKKALKSLFYGRTHLLSNKSTSVCDEAKTQLDRAFERLCGVNRFLVNVNAAQNLSETQHEIIDQLQSLNVQKNTSNRDSFAPAFYVPANPAIATEFLDYASVDSEGNPVTYEGKLKALLLQLIKKRENSHATLPIVGAVGMSGTGKTCALRGLKAEKDLRELFTDGIMFVSPKGPSPSNEDVKDVLCSLVSQTGGRVLALEMKGMDSMKLVDAIVEKASGWFKDRKCLFLVDDIWNTNAVGSSLLSKLSSVVENCDTTSGLVYTTKDDRIGVFDETVRFECLSPHSATCCNILAKAAGFTQEQIDDADQRPAFDSVLMHCKGHKMALVVGGREVRLRATRYGEHKAEAWNSYADTLKMCPHQLLTQDCGEYGSLYYQFSVSLQTLGSQESKKISFHMPYQIEEAFEALCVADKGDVLHDSMLCRLWRLESIEQAREISRLFVDASLVETTVEFLGGRYSEGIAFHDLVHDYANYLADQKYADRSWIKGWEVWSLRLLEGYFGADEGDVSSCSSFVEWWEKDDVSRDYHFQESLRRGILRVARCSRIRSGQTLLKHSSGVERFFNMSRPEPCWVEVCFTLRKSTVVELHDFLTAMAHEREVVLSDLTFRMLVFAVLHVLRFDRLLTSNHPAGELAEDSYTSSGLGTNEERCRRLGYVDMMSVLRPTQETISGTGLVSHVYVLPENFGEYLQSSIVLNWTYYDCCVEAPEMDDDEGYRLLGVPLTVEKMEKAGIAFHIVVLFSFYPSGRFKPSSAQAREVDDHVVYEFKNADNSYHFTITPIFRVSSQVGHCSSRYLHLHDIDGTEDNSFFKRENSEVLRPLNRDKIFEIDRLWSAHPIIVSSNEKIRKFFGPSTGTRSSK